jgi:nicotinamidase-related amidase
VIRVAPILLAWGCAAARPDGAFVLHARGRVEEVLRWEAARTAVIVCDMWDADWCADATRRMEALAPRVDLFVRAARREGAFVIHAPSGNMDFYAETPARRLAREAAPVRAPEPLAVRRHDPEREGPFPIDDRRSICPCEPRCALPKKKANTRQIDAIAIEEGDAVTDRGQEVYNLLVARGIRNVLFTGVHNNLCVLVRSFGIRQLRRLGFEVALVRDLTVAMYDPRERPFVSLERATELVNEHIERHWCSSADVLEPGRKP